MKSAEEFYCELGSQAVCFCGSAQECRRDLVPLLQARDREVALACAEMVWQASDDPDAKLARSIEAFAERLGKGATP